MELLNQSTNSYQLGQMQVILDQANREEVLVQRAFRCPEESCGKTFQGKGSLKVHLRSHLNERPHKCEFPNCSRSFSTKGNLKAHLFIHKDIKPFKCNYPSCDKKYINECRLRVHQRTHMGEKPFKCGICEKSFNEKGNLKTHMRIHTGERPFSCSMEGCHSAFKTSGHLKDHMKIHLEIKPFKCHMCSKKYSRSCTLKIHLRTHSGEKPFKCPYEGCGKIFSEKGNMKNHFKNHEKNKIKEITNEDVEKEETGNTTPQTNKETISTTLFSKRIFSTDLLSENKSPSIIDNDMFVENVSVSSNYDNESEFKIFAEHNLRYDYYSSENFLNSQQDYGAFVGDCKNLTQYNPNIGTLYLKNEICNEPQHSNYNQLEGNKTNNNNGKHLASNWFLN